MGIEAVFAGVAFIALFGLWVILPSRMRKNREAKASEVIKD